MDSIYKRIQLTLSIIAAVIGLVIVTHYGFYHKKAEPIPKDLIKLNVDDKHPLIKLLKQRRSTRWYSASAIDFAKISSLLFAAQGITHEKNFRAAPSAGALYPLKIYLIAIKVNDLASGLYEYFPQFNGLKFRRNITNAKKIAAYAYGQDWFKQAQAIIVIAGEVKITAKKYGPRAIDYLNMEVGAVAENIYLQATASQLGTTLVGGIERDKMKSFLKLDRLPYAIMPIGNR